VRDHHRGGSEHPHQRVWSPGDVRGCCSAEYREIHISRRQNRRRWKSEGRLAGCILKIDSKDRTARRLGKNVDQKCVGFAQLPLSRRVRKAVPVSPHFSGSEGEAPTTYFVGWRMTGDESDESKSAVAGVKPVPVAVLVSRSFRGNRHHAIGSGTQIWIAHQHVTDRRSPKYHC